MNADEFTDPARRHGTGFCRGFDRADVTAHEYRHISVEQIFFADERDIRGLDHRVGSLNRPDETASFDHPQRFL